MQMLKVLFLDLLSCWIVFIVYKVLFKLLAHGWIKGWVGLCTTTVSKQFAQDRYVADIAVDSCSNRYASLGKWMYAASSQLLSESAEARSRTAIYWIMQSTLAISPPAQ